MESLAPRWMYLTWHLYSLHCASSKIKKYDVTKYARSKTNKLWCHYPWLTFSLYLKYYQMTIFFFIYLQHRTSKLTFFLHLILNHPHFVRRKNVTNRWWTKKQWFRKCISWHKEPEMQQLISNRGYQNRWRTKTFWWLDKYQHNHPPEAPLIVPKVRIYSFASLTIEIFLCYHNILFLLSF